MNNNPTWSVDCYISGAVEVSSRFSFTEQKGFRFENQFYSNIEVSNVTMYGVKIKVTAYASTSNLAKKAALVFVGEMVDILSFCINVPLLLSMDNEIPKNNHRYDVRRVIETNEIRQSFKLARKVSQNEPTLLRALGWYRKGLITDDPMDKFLAFWNSIEIITNKYHPPLEKGREEGSKNKMWACFIDLWGDVDNWNIPKNKGKTWIDENYDTRKNIAHGIASVSINDIEKVMEKNKTIEVLALRFLIEWSRSKNYNLSSQYLIESHHTD
jgi:hypothetical protein